MSKQRIPFAHSNTLPWLSTERPDTELRRTLTTQIVRMRPDETILCWQAIMPHHQTLTEPEMGGSIFDSSGENISTTSTTSNQEHSHVLVPDQALITLENEVTWLSVESDESILPSASTNCENHSSPTNSINNTACAGANLPSQLDMRSPHQLEHLTSLVNWDFVLLERKYRDLPSLEL